jgi:thioesterase domain-containing protein
LDIEQLQRLPSAERRASIIRTLKEQGLEIDQDQFAAFHRVFEANLGCYRAVTPRTLPVMIDASLYRARHRGQQAPDMPHDYGWNALLSGPIRMFDIEADHYSMLGSEHARQIGMQLATV